MRAIAHHRRTGVLATAEVNGCRLACIKFDGCEFASFVTSVAERLIGTSTAGTPEVALAGFNINGIGAVLGNGWFGHGKFSFSFYYRPHWLGWPLRLAERTVTWEERQVNPQGIRFVNTD